MDPRRYPNALRFERGDPGGHYESFFVRANHPDRPLALWIRYTIFSPAGAPERAIGELWAAWFDGDSGEHAAVKSEHPIDGCEFDAEILGARVGGATLDDTGLSGAIDDPATPIRWRLSRAGGGPPLLLLADGLYDRSLPRAKALVGAPLARFDGEVEIAGRRVAIDGWVGSQNHNWGSRHTDRYAWGQVAGFDGAPDAFLEVATGQVKLGPIWTPRATLLVLRRGDRELAFNGLARSLRNRGRYELFDWRFEAGDRRWRVTGRISGPASAFVGLAYANPPGGTKHCLNSKIARCELTVEDRRGGAVETLTSANRAAFEILVDPSDHGVDIRC
jgi:hypothetical protein